MADWRRIGSLDEGWRRVAGTLEKDWKRRGVGGTLEKDWRRMGRSMLDRCSIDAQSDFERCSIYVRWITIDVWSMLDSLSIEFR